MILYHTYIFFSKKSRESNKNNYLIINMLTKFGRVHNSLLSNERDINVVFYLILVRILKTNSIWLISPRMLSNLTRRRMLSLSPGFKTIAHQYSVYFDRSFLNTHLQHFFPIQFLNNTTQTYTVFCYTCILFPECVMTSFCFKYRLLFFHNSYLFYKLWLFQESVLGSFCFECILLFLHSNQSYLAFFLRSILFR